MLNIIYFFDFPRWLYSPLLKQYDFLLIEQIMVGHQGKNVDTYGIRPDSFRESNTVH